MPYINDIKESLSLASRYEQLAEECMELGKVALKKARKLRNENYTPLIIEIIDSNLTEEFTDVILAAESVDLQIDNEIYAYKKDRWYHRLKKAKQNETD